VETDLKDSIAAVYCRLSKEDVDKDFGKTVSESIKNQKSMLEEYALERRWTVYDYYVDEDFSGSDRNRPEFNRLITDSLLGRFNIVLCKKQARFARDIEYVEKYIHGLFSERQIRFVAVLDNIDTGAVSRSVRKASQINSLVDEWYLSDLSENIIASLDTKRRNAEFIGSWAPYGYKKDPGNKNALIIDLEASEIVKSIFARYRNGSGISSIARDLNARSIPNPLLYKQLKGEKINPNPNKSTETRYLWSPSTVSSILHNRTYTGDLIQGKYRKASYKSKKLLRIPKEDWIVIPNCHVGIVDKDAWEEVQKRLSSGSRVTLAGKSRSLFTGLIFCGECGSKLVSSGGSSGGRRVSYLCCSGHKRSKDICPGARIEASLLEDLLLSRINALTAVSLDEACLLSQIGHDRICSHSDRPRLESVLQALEARLSLMDRKKGILYSDRLSGVISCEQYLEFKAKLERESKNLQLEQRSLRDELSSYEEKLPDPADGTSLQKFTFSRSQLTREIVEQLVETIYIGRRRKGSPQEITINWSF
jgi:DNA invertase Pin-like site-specific DNA recombinase